MARYQIRPFFRGVIGKGIEFIYHAVTGTYVEAVLILAWDLIAQVCIVVEHLSNILTCCFN